MIFTSIRWRLQAWHGALLVALVAGFGFTAYRLMSSDRLRQIDDELQAKSALLGVAFPPVTESDAGRTGQRRPPPREGGTLPEQITAAGAYFVVWHPDGRVQSRSANAPEALVIPAHTSGDESHLARTRGTAREFVRFTKADRCFLVGRDISAELSALHRSAWYLAGAGATVVALGLLGGGWLAARSLRPVENISATAEKIASGDLSQRIEADGFADELSRLAGVLNSTFSRLDAAFAQQARFTADAAHELRTPVSVILMHAQNGLASEHLTDEQREAFESCQRAAQRMRRLIDSLLELARFDAGQETIKHEPCDLAHVARECVDLVQPLADQRRISLHLDASEAKCAGDAGRIAQVITNLLTNAIEYNRDGGDVRLIVQRKNGSVLASVADNGPGIAAEDLPHVFERFYRADVSRTNGARRSGLGLAISRAIVEAHGGTLSASSTPGEGAVFTMKLPAGE